MCFQGQHNLYLLLIWRLISFETCFFHLLLLIQLGIGYLQVIMHYLYYVNYDGTHGD